MAAIDSEEGDGVGVGVFDLMRHEVNSLILTSKAGIQIDRCKIRVDTLHLQSPAHLSRLRPLPPHQGPD